MSQITSIEGLIRYFNSKQATDIELVEIKWKNGEKSGIANLPALQAILDVIEQELINQSKK